jgi:tetratricopeptide (TPR) repeat protein
MRAQISYAGGAFIPAVALADSALALVPGDTTAAMVRRDASDKGEIVCLNRARISRKSGDFAAAEMFYVQALAADSLCVPAHTELATLYSGAGMFDKGLEQARRAVTSAPGDPALLVNLAVMNMNLNRPGEAEPLLKRALEMRPGFDRANYFLAMLYRERAEKETVR